MKPSKHAFGERTGQMVDNHGHMEFRYDPPPAPERRNATADRCESMAVVELRRRHDGWTAERQGVFLNVLANTGSIASAAEAADITPRSAYRLRNHPKGAAFARAMDAAIMAASKRLIGVAFERAITGTPRTIWRNGEIVAETSIPSDRMLMFLLKNLTPDLFGRRGDPDARAARIDAMQGGFADAMAAIVDTDVEADLLDINDYRRTPPPEESA